MVCLFRPKQHFIVPFIIREMHLLKGTWFIITCVRKEKEQTGTRRIRPAPNWNQTHDRTKFCSSEVCSTNVLKPLPKGCGWKALTFHGNLHALVRILLSQTMPEERWTPPTNFSGTQYSTWKVIFRRGPSASRNPGVPVPVVADDGGVALHREVVA